MVVSREELCERSVALEMLGGRSLRLTRAARLALDMRQFMKIPTALDNSVPAPELDAETIAAHAAGLAAGDVGPELSERLLALGSA